MGSSLRILGSLRGAAVLALAASSKKCPVAAGFSTINYYPRSSSSSSSRHSYSTIATTLMRMTSDSNNNLFLFDFDGVVCDSCDECTVSAWRTCSMLNAIPNNFDTTQDKPPQWLFEKMREIRPAIEVGWQIPVLLSVFLDQQVKSSPLTVQEVLESYEQLVEEWLKKYKLTDKDMIQTFGKVRDDWIAGKSSLS